MKNSLLIFALMIALTSCGQGKKIPAVKKEIHDGMTYDYVLYPKQDSLRYYVSPEGDTFKVSMVFHKLENGYPLPDIITEIDNALSESSLSLLYTPQSYSGDNIINPLGWNFSKGQLFNVAHHANTLAFLQVDGWVEYSFNGHKVEYYAEKFESYGIAGVSIDRGPETMVDLYSPVEYNNSQAVFVADSLKNDSVHVIRVRYTHQRNPNSNSQYARINLDKFVTYYSQGNLYIPPSDTAKAARMQYEQPKTSNE